MKFNALITRPQPDAQALQARLEAQGAACVLSPMLKITDADDLAETLRNVAKAYSVQALVVTSRNAARALIRHAPPLPLPVLTVGEATTRMLRDAGWAQATCAGVDVAGVCMHIRGSCDPKRGALCYVSGAQITLDLAAALTPHGFTVQRVIAYTAEPCAHLSGEAVRALSDGTLSHALFYSRRTAEIFRLRIADGGLERTLRPVTAVAISGAVAEALKPMPWKAVIAAPTPDTDGMLAALSRK